MKEQIILYVKTEFTEFPGLRLHCESSGVSGEDFYHNVLNKRFYEAISSKKRIVVNLDGTAGYPPSFIDESFGRLIYDFGEDLVRANLSIVSDEEPIWKDMIENSTFTKWEARRKKNLRPECSENYTPIPWWHNFNGEYKEISSYEEC